MLAKNQNLIANHRTAKSDHRAPMTKRTEHKQGMMQNLESNLSPEVIQFMEDLKNGIEPGLFTETDVF